MRAHEFITEAKKAGKVSKRYQQATRGLMKFVDPTFADRIYELNRVMMAAGSSDGKSPLNIDSESWIGRYDLAVPYTEVEQQKLIQAYKAIGSKWKDLNRKDLKSKELDSINKQSPMKPFKGYSKK
jgi:hypothetical protein